MNLKKLVSMILSLLISCPAFSKADLVDQYVQCEMKFNKISGLAMAVFQTGKQLKMMSMHLLPMA